MTVPSPDGSPKDGPQAREGAPHQSTGPRTRGSHGIWLVLGGARSGKSHFAETVTLDLARGRPALYVATAWAGDGEMADRIALHQARRGAQWITREEQVDLGALIRCEARPDRPILIDCLTLWVSNLLHHERPFETAMDDLVSALDQASGPVILVANEVGLGIVPDNRLARLFRDQAGTLNRRIAATADEVRFIAAGLPLTLKSR